MLEHYPNSATFPPYSYSFVNYKNDLSHINENASKEFRYYNKINANYANIKATTLMLENYINIERGQLEANNIIISESTNMRLSENVLLKGNVYLVDQEEFTNINNIKENTWFFDSIHNNISKYLDEHHVKYAVYNDEPYDSHLVELMGNNLVTETII